MIKERSLGDLEETESLREGPSAVGAEHDCYGGKVEIAKILVDLELCDYEGCPWKEEGRKVKQGLYV